MHKDKDDLWEVLVQFEEWFRNLRRICKVKAPWIFLCLSAVIDYLSRLEKGAIGYRDDYVEFVKDYFPEKYKKFDYRSGDQDLPKQMYYCLRNGIVHSFSLIPTPLKRGKKDGRDRSIVLDHAVTANRERLSHLDNYSGKNQNLDAAYFVAEDFLHDAEHAAYNMLQKARKNSTLKKNIADWYNSHPPIRWEI